MLMIGVWSVAGRPCITVIRKTVMFNIVYTGQSDTREGEREYGNLSLTEMPSVIFSPDSAGIRKTNLGSKRNHLIFPARLNSRSYSAKMLIRTAGWM